MSEPEYFLSVENIEISPYAQARQSPLLLTQGNIYNRSRFLNKYLEYHHRILHYVFITYINFSIVSILVTRASDLMAAHDPRLWETLQEFSQNLAIWTSRRMLVEQTAGN